MTRTLLPATALALAASAGLAVAAPAPSGPEVLVRYAPGADRAEATREAGAAGAWALGRTRAVRLRLDPGTTAGEALRTLRARDDVVWAEPVVVYRALGVPNDPLFGRQWGLRNLGAPVEGLAAVPGADIDAAAAWDITTGSPAVSVGIVDSGIAYDHPDLAPNVAPEDPGEDFVDGDRDPRDMDGHGTLVAGIAGARGNDGVGVAGVSWNSRLVGLRALDAEGAGTSAQVAQAFAAAGARRLRVVNASLGGPGLSLAVRDAIAQSPGTLFVVAAGNDGADVDATPTYPCALDLPNVLCVASLDAADRLSSSSNHGARAVDIAAPGVDVTGPAPAYDAPVLAEDFETPLTGRWLASAGATWARDPGAAASGAAGLADSPGGPYAGPGTQILRAASAVDVRGRLGCRVFLQLRLDTRPGDEFAIDVSRDGGSFQPLRTFSGSSRGRFIAVSEYLGAAGSVRLQLRFTAQGAGGGEGADVDDLRVACQGGPYGPEDFVTESGTSFAAPHVAGVAALVAARHPGLGPADIKLAILRGAVPVPALRGRVATGGRLSASRALREADAIAGTAAPAAAPPPVARPVTAERLRAALAAPRRRAGVWTADLRLSRPALAEITLERRVRRPAVATRRGARAVRPRYVLVRTTGPRDRRAGVVRYRLGRLGPGVYRVTVVLAEDRRVLRRTLTVTAPARRR
ncbi:MAG TPA: S8 family serine peptidase [Miltoncostaeaceae bacterium]|nr:S8 family serine peptidase [Miltoncostaeaceae bacterium]